MDYENLEDKFYGNYALLTHEEIMELDASDNGPINNVVAGISTNCYGVKLYDDKHCLAADMFHINNEESLQGKIFRIDLFDEDYFLLLLKFCNILAESYKDVDALDSFNIFQTKLRGFLEKCGFSTITDFDLKPFEGKGATLITSAQRGFYRLRLIDKPDFLRDFLDSMTAIEPGEGREYVYLMLNSDTSLIKIGMSNKPGYREKTLQSQEPNVNLIASWCCSKTIEKQLHQRYKTKRIRGEWFRLTLNDLREIEQFMNSLHP